jgi:DNA polymerase-3 subunit delta'
MRKFIGYRDLVKNFNKRCSNGTLSHAHLICGEDGIGKSVLALNLAKLILKGDLDREYVDIINYKTEKASFGVDDVRAIIEEVQKKPFEGDKKVVIIHEGNKLTVQAQNALLKTIEEPPLGVYIIILCESLVLDTIKSRCEIFKLTPLSKEELYEYAEIKGYDKNEPETKAAIAFSSGIPGRIDRYINDDKLKELRCKIVELLIKITKNDPEALLEEEEVLNSYKGDKEEVLSIMGDFIRDIMIHKEIENESLIINSDKIDQIKELTREMSFRKLNNLMSSIEEARRNIKNNVNWAVTIRVMLISFLEV